MTAGYEQACQRRYHEQPVAVLPQAAIAHFGKVEDALDDQKGVLDLGTHLRLGPILLPLLFGELFVPGCSLVGEVLGLGRSPADESLLACLGRIAIDLALLAM